MANTAAVCTHTDNELKENAENILSQLDISPSGAIQMLYSQIVLKRGFPLNLQLPPVRPTAVGGMSQTKLDTEFTKEIESSKSGEFYTADDVGTELTKELGL